MTTEIYILKFPNIDKVYIGKTTKGLSFRLNQHINNLKGNSHKMQKHFPECGEPIIELLEKCSDELANEREIYWVSKFNSFINGTEGGDKAGIGHNHNAAKYTADDYACILHFLAHTSMSHAEISSELEVSIDVVIDISAGRNHKNLEELYPEDYDLAMTKTRQGQYRVKNRGKIVSPEGTIYEVRNMSDFARDHNINLTCLWRVLNKQRKSTLGWRLLNADS